ncbi:MAG: hypothetical protein SNJ75_13455 [Gemmataceae bacterium]
MTTSRVTRYFVASVFLMLLTAVQVIAGEVAAPAGAEIKFDPDSPISGQKHIAGCGTYKVPAKWVKSEISLRVYTVVAGKKGVFVKQSLDTANQPDIWNSLVPGLTANTEYWVEGRLTVKPDTLVPNFDYAYL